MVEKLVQDADVEDWRMEDFIITKVGACTCHDRGDLEHKNCDMVDIGRNGIIRADVTHGEWVEIKKSALEFASSYDEAKNLADRCLELSFWNRRIYDVNGPNTEEEGFYLLWGSQSVGIHNQSLQNGSLHNPVGRIYKIKGSGKKYYRDIKQKLMVGVLEIRDLAKIHELDGNLPDKWVSRYHKSIYIIKMLNPDGNADYYKIGVSVDVPERLSQLQTGCPEPLELVFEHKVSNAIVLEKEWHEYFKEFNTMGEWFKLENHQMEEFIDSIFDNAVKETKKICEGGIEQVLLPYVKNN